MSEKSIFDYQIEILNNELKSIDGAIRQHDEITKSVKNWAVVTWTASLGFTLKELALNPYIALTAVIPLVFWLVDGSFRRIQRSFIARLEEIELFFNSESFKVAASTGSAIDFPLLARRRKIDKFKNTLLGAMCFRSVALLYVGLAACSIAVWYTRLG